MGFSFRRYLFWSDRFSAVLAATRNATTRPRNRAPKMLQLMARTPLLRHRSPDAAHALRPETELEIVQVTSRGNHAQEQRHEARVGHHVIAGTSGNARTASSRSSQALSSDLRATATVAATLPFVAISSRGSVLLRDETLGEPSPTRGAAHPKEHHQANDHAHRFPSFAPSKWRRAT